jgi:energy-coupling factor transporter ATP-binding protein EcfA2
MNILILGHKGHGKTTVAKLLSLIYNLKWADSSDVANETIVFPVLKDKYDYKTPKECYADVDNHRCEWEQLINQWCDPLDKLTKLILKNSNIYAGMRNNAEYQASKHLFDLTIWVKADSRVGGTDESMSIKVHRIEMFVLNNNGDLRQTSKSLMNIMRMNEKYLD